MTLVRPRAHLRRSLLRRVQQHALSLDPLDLDGPTMVLAPHPDDETLPSGGLIARLRDRGAPVEIVFVTDGAASHAEWSGETLAEVRKREAIAAAEVLGVDEDHLHFWGLPDGALTHHVEDAAARLVEQLRSIEPSRLVLPHHLEPNRDHAATFEVAAAAVRAYGRPMEALAYFVWFWDQWPWTDPTSEPKARHGRRQVIETALRGRLGIGVGRRLTHAVDVSNVLDRKRAALGMHATQISPPSGRSDWWTLEDVAGGDWLDLLLQPYELFALGELTP